LNTYAYVENDPLRFIDPFGLEHAAQPGDSSIYPATQNCTCTKNCMKQDVEVPSVCKLIPYPKLKIGDAKIKIPGPDQLCSNLIQSVKCDCDCGDFCSGKTQNNPYPEPTPLATPNGPNPDAPKANTPAMPDPKPQPPQPKTGPQS
jgi:hypothetical protein